MLTEAVLSKYLPEVSDQSTADFEKLSTERRSQLMLEIFYRLLRDAGREGKDFNLAYTAADTLFGELSGKGDISLTSRAIKTQSGGSISLFAPGVDITADTGWIERLLLILLDNAIKFTPAGGRVTVAVDADAQRAWLSVADTGVGIDAPALPHVFEPFYRAYGRSDGAGIGLALAKWIADAHGADLAVTSAPGAGSTFRFSLPALVRAREVAND